MEEDLLDKTQVRVLAQQSLKRRPYCGLYSLMNGSPYACVIQAVVLGGSANLTEKLLAHHHDESDEAAASLANLVLHMQYTKSHKSLPILLRPPLALVYPGR